MASLVTLATYYNLSEALVANSILEQHGFSVFVLDSFYGGLDWGRIIALGGLRLTVPEPEANDAAHLLSSATPIPSEETDPIDLCPHCGSDNVFRYAHWLSLLIILLISVSAIFAKGSKRRRCRDCGHRWRI